MSATQYRAQSALPAAKGPKRRVWGVIERVPPDVWLVGALTAVAAVLRFATIASQSYWADEALTVHEVGLPFGQMLSAVAHLETTPPLYFILAWAWAHVFGTGEAALRSLSAVIGIAVVPIAYLCAREFVSRRAGVIAATFAAVNPFLIWYSQEARAYMLLIALTGGSLLWWIRAERDPSRRNVVWWAILSGLALATHFFAGFLIAPEALWLLWRTRSRLVLAAGALLVAVQLALVPLAAQDTSHGLGWIHATPLLTRIAQVPTEFAVMTVYRHVSIAEGLWGGAITILVAVLLLAFASGRAERRGAERAGALAAAVIIFPLGLAVARPADDFFLVRNLSAAWIPICVVLAAACAAPRARDAGAIAMLVLVGMFAIAALAIDRDHAFQRADWRGVARALGMSSEPRAILVTGGQEAFPLKIFVPGVRWTQPPLTQRVLVDEVDVVGSLARAPLRGPDHRKGRALPRASPPNAVLLSQTWVRNFDVARYELIRPWRLDTTQISARAGHFFRHRAPTQLLVIVAGGVPRRGPIPFAPQAAPVVRHQAHARRGHHAGRRGTRRHRVVRRRLRPRRLHPARALATGHESVRRAVSSEGCIRELKAARAIGSRSSYRCWHARLHP